MKLLNLKRLHKLTIHLQEEIINRFAEEIPKNLFERLKAGVTSNAVSKPFKKLTKTTLRSTYKGAKRSSYGKKPMRASGGLLRHLVIIKERTRSLLVLAPSTETAKDKIKYNQSTWKQIITERQRMGLPKKKDIYIRKSKKAFRNPERNVYGVNTEEIDKIIKLAVDKIFKGL